MKAMKRFVCLGLLLLGGCQNTQPLSDSTPPPVESLQSKTVTDQQKLLSTSETDLSKAARSAEQSRTDDAKSNVKNVVDWTKPSGGAYPDLTKGRDIWLDVSIHDQKVYVKEQDDVIYTMVMSSGLDVSPDNTTPQGTYYIEPERGTWFYNKKEQEGAMYWVSWKNHGEFLFHSVPMNEDKSVIVDEAAKLGEKASHGCFRLTIPDAKWIYEQIPKHTKVVIRS